MGKMGLISYPTLTLWNLKSLTPWTSKQATTRYAAETRTFPTSGGTGPATHHTRITNYQHQPEMPHYVKHQTPNDFARSLTQKHIKQKLLDGYFVIITEDLNDSPDSYSFKVFMTTNQLMNFLHAAFNHNPTFHTRDANLSKIKHYY
jgi:hypothetical protein